MFNQITLQGNLTKDIELKYLQSGTAVGNTSIAVNKKYKTQSGEQKEEVLFLDVTMFGKTAEIANQYLKRGAKVLLAGELKLDTWKAQDGTNRSKHSMTANNLVMLDSKPDGQPQQQQGSQQPQPQHNVTHAQVNTPNGNIPVEITQDEIPF